ncbi:MAG: hypothetical protein ACK4M7_00620, partial [Burkholderiales bacterium]
MKISANYTKHTLRLGNRLNNLSMEKTEVLSGEFKLSIAKIIKLADKKNALMVAHFLMGKKTLQELPQNLQAQIDADADIKKILEVRSSSRHLKTYINSSVARIIKEDVLKSGEYFNAWTEGTNKHGEYEKTFDKLHALRKYDFHNKQDGIIHKAIKPYNSLPVVKNNIPIGLPNKLNDCFVNSAIQFILNNEILLKTALNHPDLAFRQNFQMLYYNLSENKSIDIDVHKNLVKIIRQYAYLNPYAQYSTPVILRALFHHSPAILCVTVDFEASIAVDIDKYNVFGLLTQAVVDDSLLKEAVNKIPFTFMEKNGEQQPISRIY